MLHFARGTCFHPSLYFFIKFYTILINRVYSAPFADAGQLNLQTKAYHNSGIVTANFILRHKSKNAESSLSTIVQIRTMAENFRLYNTIARHFHFFFHPFILFSKHNFVEQGLRKFKVQTIIQHRVENLSYPLTSYVE